MQGLKEEARIFRTDRLAESAEARQRAALRLCCGIDFEHLAQAGPDQRPGLISRLRRAIERERLKGTRLHWSYDLNRHIALKQALDRFEPAEASVPRKVLRRRRRSACQKK